jgi:hypothetical protein
MAKEININSITVILLDRKGKYSDLIQSALNQNASSVPALSGITHNDAAMHGFGNALQATVTKFKASPPTATKADVDIDVNNLVDAYDQDAGEIEAIARKEAKAAGDVNVGINIVQKAGYKLKSPKSAVEITFDVKPDGPKAVKVTTKAVALRAIYIREYAQVSDNEIVPEKSAIQEWLVGFESTVRLENMRTGSWYAFREAYIVPVSRKPSGEAPNTNAEKKATPTLVDKARRRTFQFAQESNYNFGPWVWVLVQ